MNRLLAMAVLVFGAAAAGCCQQAAVRDKVFTWESNEQKAGDLRVTLATPTRQLTAGAVVPVVVDVENTSSQPVTVESPSAALVTIRLLRRVEGGWAEVRRYPEMSAQVVTPWTLGPRQTRRFAMDLVASPDWPTHEPLRLTAEIGGRPEFRPGVVVNVGRY
jgi:hypothetical protein